MRSEGPKEPGGSGNQWENGNCRDYIIGEVGYNTEKSPGNLKRLAIDGVKNSEGVE